MSTPDGSPVAMAVDPSTAVTVASTTTRRVPPPCWNDEETAALVNAYKDKWFALRRGNLRAADWDDVAAAVSSLHTLGGPAKSAIQCRHKIEKLRKRYRGEKQRSLNRPGKFSSSWDLFPILDAMELKGSHGKPSSGEFGGGFPLKSFGDRSFASHGFKAKNFSKPEANFSPEMDYDDEFDEGFNPRIQHSRSSSRANGYGRKDGSYPRSNNTGVSNGYGSSSRFKHEQMNAADVESDPIDEVVSSVKMLTEMFVRVENSKMEMMREMEKTRMEMELKHCQMMLESQQQIIGAFAEALSEKKSTNARRPGS
ncbi:BnaA01g17960D [Brassica napus]|uniref:BnaA01g17960D protein n=1 Tax=Brassica napus TaxID=3708 RepID=A0A078I1K5_BRANA|nr:BnaA01g17960D [Brassica napus]